MEGPEASRPPPTTDQKMEEMAAAMKAVCNAAKADRARQDWLEAEVERHKRRAHSAEQEKAAVHDRLKQLEAAFEEQSQKAALAWKWQQEVSRLQEKLGRRSLQVLARDKELEKVKKELKDTADLLANQQAALAASRAKYNRLAEHLAALSENVAAAKSAAGAPPPSIAAATIHGNSSVSSGGGAAVSQAGVSLDEIAACLDKVQMVHNSIQLSQHHQSRPGSRPASRRASNSAGSMLTGQGAPTSNKISAAGSYSPKAAAAGWSDGGGSARGPLAAADSKETSEGGFEERQCQLQSCPPSSTSRGGCQVSKSSDGKRGGMLSMLRAPGAAVASALATPRNSKKKPLPYPRHNTARNVRALCTSRSITLKEEAEAHLRACSTSNDMIACSAAAFQRKSSDPSYAAQHSRSPAAPARKGQGSNPGSGLVMLRQLSQRQLRSYLDDDGDDSELYHSHDSDGVPWRHGKLRDEASCP